ncbi:MAG: pentapeptide repeat-containing protein [Alphaproteobacteria bacterium]|nr:pentapeptide repeat-containing protein [Alphaproteobacteria bacterium]
MIDEEFDCSDVLFARSYFPKFRFNHLKLRSADFTEAQFWQCSFQQAKCERIKFGNSKLTNVEFNGANLTKSFFSEADITQAMFQNNIMAESIFERAKISQSSFSNSCNLKKGIFDGATIVNCDFSTAYLEEATFVNAECYNVNFSRIKATKANFTKAKFTTPLFSSAILDQTNFTKSILETPHFTDANLIGSKFDEASTTNAFFNKANLDHASFLKADLGGAAFTEAIKVTGIEQGQELVKEAQIVSTSVDLAKSFDLKNLRLKKDQETAERLYLGMILLIAILTIVFAFQTKELAHSYKEKLEWWHFSVGFIFYAVFIVPFVWIAKYFGNKNRMYITLCEFYDHKSTIAKALIGFKDTQEENADELVALAFDRLTRSDPALKVMQKSESYELPLIDVVKKFLEEFKKDKA